MPQLWSKGRGPYALLILLLLTIFVLPPLVTNGILIGAFELALALVLIEGTFTVPRTWPVRWVAIIIVLAAIVARVMHWYTQEPSLAFAEAISTILALGLFAILMIMRFLGGQPVRFRIAGAIVVYLLLGLMWARLYEIIWLIDPHAFQMAHTEDKFTMIYFSFVTLLTIGYGDVVPVSILARHVAILEGLFGQLYMVIFISYLVSELVREKKTAAQTVEKKK